MRNLVIVLGDQLDARSAAFDGFDPARDRVWMAEVAEESTHVWSAKQRIVLFLSAMRYFANGSRAAGRPVDYVLLDDPANTGTLAGELARAVRALRPRGLVMVRPGDWRVLRSLEAAARDLGLPLDLREDRHFFTSPDDFRRHAEGRRQLRLEHWYRELRRRTGILMRDGEPLGGQWNYDAENRAAFGRDGPGLLPAPLRFEPDAITREVIALVERRFPDHPGSLRRFGWAVTREQGLLALSDFIDNRLELFGRHEDAMWEGEAWLYHSQLSPLMNLKLLHPREVVAAAEDAYVAGEQGRRNRVPLASVEGFIRQILGWREYVRGIYWLHMPDYASRNAYAARGKLPAFFWTGETELRCLADALHNTLEHGYAHHIQRLMVIGNYALMLGVEPRQVHVWYLSVYVDAVEWVELPNTIGMSQAADGGLMASKPYVATGRYIDRMSNHCARCHHRPEEAEGPRACPFTTLYWDFLFRHERSLACNPRMALQVKNAQRVPEERRIRIIRQAREHRERVGSIEAGTPVDRMAEGLS